MITYKITEFKRSTYFNLLIIASFLYKLKITTE